MGWGNGVKLVRSGIRFVGELLSQARYVKKNGKRNVTDGAVTGAVGGVVVGAISSGPGAAASAAIGGLGGAAAGAAKTVHDSWYETKVVSAGVELGKAVVKTAWDAYKD